MTRTVQLPPLHILLNGQPLNQQAMAALQSMTVHQVLCMPAQCEIRFSFQENPSFIPIGAEINIRVGNKAISLFTGEVTACEQQYHADGCQNMVVRCYDLLHRLRKQQHLRQFEDISLASLAEKLTSGLGLSVQIHSPDVRIRQVLQWLQSDLALLNENIQRYGFYSTVWDGQFHIFSLSGLPQNNIELEWGRNLISAIAALNAEPACRSVEVFGWDPQSADVISGKANADSLLNHGTAPDKVGVSGQRFLAGLTLASAEEAEKLGQAMLERRMSGEAVFQGVAEGNPLLHPGIRILLVGVAEELRNTPYLLTSVQHSIDRSQGYLCQLDTSPPPVVETGQYVRSSMGIVVDIDDPDKQGRIKVAFPGLGMLESLWLEVVHPGAGQNKGLVALPEKDDRVLVLFINGDPCQCIVLGGLYGKIGPPDDGIRNGRVECYTLTTARGQKVFLDGDQDIVKISNRDGSCLELSPEKVTLNAKSNIIIQAAGKKITFRANQIDFEQE